MEQTRYMRLLMGSDLRTLKHNRVVVDGVTNQLDFDELFQLIFHHERPLVMRVADAVEKISLRHPEYLTPHKGQLLAVMKSVDHKELKWHIAQLISRLTLTDEELVDVWHMLTYWALNRNESKIVRVNALQGLFDLAAQFPHYKKDMLQTMHAMDSENIPSIRARIRKLQSLK